MDRTTELPRSVAELSEALGSVLGAAFGTIAHLRGGRKALHPHGVVVGGRLAPVGHEPTGVPWADELAPTQVVVRSSRSAGLPFPLPDIIGLALRIPLGDDGFGDLLLASSATHPLVRYLPVPRIGMAGPYTSLLPFATPVGLRLVAALPRGHANALGLGVRRTFDLAIGTSTGQWTTFAVLTLDADPFSATDEPIDFEPVGNQLPGLGIPEPLARLRAPSYRESRAQRRFDLRT